MRWERLFEDLEAQLSAAERAELAGEVADRTRREVARLRLVDRLRSAIGHPLSVSLRAGEPVSGRLSGVGPDWLLLEITGGREALVMLAALTGIHGLGARSAAPGSEGRVAARLGLRYALGGIARDRAPVALTLLDATTLTGTLDRVGADFVELAEHPLDEPRRRGDVLDVRTIPMGGISVVLRH